jgi:hypothetical protein
MMHAFLTIIVFSCIASAFIPFWQSLQYNCELIFDALTEKYPQNSLFRASHMWRLITEFVAASLPLGAQSIMLFRSSLRGAEEVLVVILFAMLVVRYFEVRHLGEREGKKVKDNDQPY